MANAVIVLGKSGTGKSTSIKGLDPSETCIVNILGKRLPFKGSNSAYNKKKKNLFKVENYTAVVNMLENINKSAPHIKNVVIDDAIYIMRKEFFTRAKETGYVKFTELAQHFQQIISTIESMREDLNVFLLLHSEEVYNDGNVTGFKVATVGRMLDEKYNPVEVVPMVLYSDVKYDDKGLPTYGFYVHRCKAGTVEIPAKTPEGMFDADFIPNDLGIVVKAMNGYYNE